MTTTLHGTCACGQTMTRPTPAGPFAELIERMPYVCDPCIDRQERDQAAADTAEKAERAATRRHARFGAAGLPANLAAVNIATLDASNNRDAFAAAERWAAGGMPGLVLTGPLGTGKTTLAAAALWRLLARTAGRWISAPELLARLGTGFGDAQRTIATDALLGRGALVLDDIDKVRPTEYGAEQLFVAIDNCIANARPLLVTTNMSLGEIAGRYPSSHGEAIASRLAGLGAAYRMGGRDRRLSAGEAA